MKPGEEQFFFGLCEADNAEQDERGKREDFYTISFINYDHTVSSYRRFRPA